MHCPEQVHIISRSMDWVIRDFIGCITPNRKDSNVQMISIVMYRDVVSSLLGHIREVNIIVKHILSRMIVRIVWEDIVMRKVILVRIMNSLMREVIEGKIISKHILIVRMVRIELG